MSNATDAKVPTFSELKELKEASLGRKRVVFPNKKAEHNEVRKCLEDAFPKLQSQAGAFEFLRAERGGKYCPLSVLPMSPKGYTIEHIKETVSAGSVIYIRPMQDNLSKSKVPSAVDKSLVTQCKECRKNIPINLIRSHLSSCVPRPAKDNNMPVSEFLELNPPKMDQSTVIPRKSVQHNFKYTTCNAQSTSTQHPICHTAAATCSSAEADDEKEWSRKLSLMFPDLEDEKINDALVGADSLDEAANALIDSVDDAAVEVVTDSPKRDLKPSMKQIFSVSKNIPPRNLDSFLIRFSKENVSDEYEEMTVNREGIWKDALKYYKRKVHDVTSLKKRLEVSFEGEDGLDGGAMKMEFFQLVFDEVSKRLFEGDSLNAVPVKDSSKLFLFRLTGMLIVHMILQDGPFYTIPALAPSVAEAILGGGLEETVPFLSKHHIPLNSSTEALHDLIERLDVAKTEEELQMLMDKDESKEVFWQLVNSCHWPITEAINLRNKTLLMQELIYNELVASRKQEIGELQAGLETLGFLAYAKENPAFAKEISCLPQFQNGIVG